MGSPEVRQTVIGDHNIFTATGDVRINYHLPPAEAEERRILLQLADSVKRFWIEGVLEHSLHEAAMLELCKEPISGVVQHPWELVLELPGQSSQPIAGEKKIGEIFFETGRSLLILGEPGAGKTVTLLELARELIGRFETGPTESAPVVLNLSTWQDKRGSLASWIEAELKNKYFVPLRRSRAWLASSRLFLLLDGLDEVSARSRAPCVHAINEFLRNTGVPGIAVCSRRTEYTALPERLSFTGAVCLQPLTADQIDGYLEGGGSRLAALRQVIRKDPPLQELAHSPLMLNVISLAYQDLPAEIIADQNTKTAESRRIHLFEYYVKRMFQRVGKAPDAYPQERTKRWLSWLAREMRRRSLVVFLLEDLQPSWLPSAGQRWVYAISSRVSIAQGWMLLLFIFAVAEWRMARQDWLAQGVAITVLTGTVGGIVAGVTAGHRLTSAPRRASKRAERLSVLAEIFIHLFVMGTVLGLLTGPFLEPAEQFALAITPGPEALRGWQLGVLAGVKYGLIFGLLFGLGSAWRTADHDIRLSGTFKFSFAAVRKGAKSGAITGAIVGGILGAIVFILQGQYLMFDQLLVVAALLLTCFLAAIILSLLFAFIATMFSLFSPSDLPVNIRPGQGAVLSAQNALLAGVVVTALYWIPAAIIGAVSHYNDYLQLAGWQATCFGVAAAVWYGGLDVVQHLTLRFLLRKHGYIPKDYVSFLDYAARLIFLQKVGSGYIFVHRQLLDYFSGPEPPESNLGREFLETSVAERDREKEKRPLEQPFELETERTAEVEKHPKEQEHKGSASKRRRRVLVAAGVAGATLILIALLVFEGYRVTTALNNAKEARARGDLLVTQGKLPEALDSYQKSVATMKHLRVLIESNNSSQQDLSVYYEKVGNVFMAQGKLLEALDAYQQELAIDKHLTEQDKSNTVWQRNLSVCYQKIGDVLMVQGKLPETLDAYQQGLHIRRALAEQDKSNRGFQWDLAASYGKVGNVLGAQGKLPEALDAYQQDLAIAKLLADQDKSNPVWPQRLSWVYQKVGDVLLAQGKLDEVLNGAIPHYTQAIQLDPDNAEAHFGRARARQIIADFQGALRDLRRFMEVAPQRQNIQDYPHLFLWLLRARQGQIAEANQELSAYIEKRSDASAGDWVTKIGGFLLDKIAETDFVAAASSPETEKDRGQHCEAWYYSGMKHLLGGDKKTAADYFTKCLATQETAFMEYAWAQAELKALGTTN